MFFYNLNLDVGSNVDQLDLQLCMHTLEKQTLVFLIHAHFAVTTVLSNVLRPNHFFQQNKLTITFNKMITSGKYD